MLRTAVKLLLALVLCLNGFLAPVAMAAHSGAMAAPTTAEAPSCHGMDEAATPDAPVTDDAGAPAPHPSCCKPGHCVCACVFSLGLPDSAYAGAAANRSAILAFPVATALHPARLPVPLRPPIA